MTSCYINEYSGMLRLIAIVVAIFLSFQVEASTLHVFLSGKGLARLKVQAQ